MLSRKFMRKRSPAVGWAVPTEPRHCAWDGGHGPPYEATDFSQELRGRNSGGLS